jgi:hypothetical protein
MYRLFLFGDQDFSGFRSEFPDVTWEQARELTLTVFFVHTAGNFRSDGADGGGSELGDRYLFWERTVSETPETVTVTQVFLRSETFYPFVIALTAAIAAGLYFVLRAAHGSKKKEAA